VTNPTSASAKEIFDTNSLDNLKKIAHKEVMKAQRKEEADSCDKHWEVLSGLMNELIEISCDTENPDRWSKSKIVEAKIRKLGVPTTEIKEHKMKLLSAKLGLDLEGLNGTAGAVRTLSKSHGPSQSWLIPQFLPVGKASVVYGDSGAGKTSIALHMANAYIKGIPFADSIYPSRYDGRKVLFIASDGQGDAVDHLADYAERSGFMDDETFVDNFDVYAAADDGTTGPFNFSEIHLLNLFNQLKGGCYGLVFIDSLKASCMGSDYSIDDRSVAQPMRIVQAMCAKTRTTLVWLHHTNKGSSDTSHRASGSTDIIEIVSSAHELRYNWNEASGQGRGEWIVQKLRGSSKRKFYYSFDCETGLVLETMSGETPKTSDRILLIVYGSPNKRLKREDVSTRLGLKPKTLSNHATHLKEESLIKMNGQAWELTGKGIQRAKELLQAEQTVGATE
jgi:archaellum biogenesis ATPase FlaH